MPDHPSLSAFISPQSGYFCAYVLFISNRPVARANAQTFLFRSLLQFQGARVPLSRKHVLVWNHNDHLYTLHTTVIVLGPAVIFQAIAITNKYIDPSFDGVWSQFKFGVVFLVILVITRLNARFPPSLVPLSGPLLWNNEKLGLI